MMNFFEQPPVVARLEPPGCMAALNNGAGAFAADLRFLHIPNEPGAAADALDRTEAAADPAEVDVWQTGYDAGFAAAAAEGAAATQAQDQAATQLRSALTKLDEAAQEEVSTWLAETVSRMCSSIFAEAGLHMPTLQERCRKAATELGEAANRIALHLCPDDIPLLDPDFRQGWKIVPDSTLPRGTLRLQGNDESICEGPEVWSRQIREALNLC